MEKAYLDYNATTPIEPRVYESMVPYIKESFGNPSSIHSFGSIAKSALDNTRDKVGELINCSSSEIIFTTGGSESNNFAIKGIISYYGNNKKNHLITTKVEHASCLETYRFFENCGYRVTYLNVDEQGLIDSNELKDSIGEDTLLVSVIYANNETGVLSPIDKIAQIVKERGTLFHTDAVQAVGKEKIDLQNIPVDLMSFSGHKLYGPKGVGALFVRKGIDITPLVHGGGQERGRRSGTENVPAIVGFGSACKIAKNEYIEENNRVKLLRDELQRKIEKSINNVRLNGHPHMRLSNTLNMSIQGVEGDALVMNLDLEGYAVSTGSACSEGNIDPSHVLLAMGLSEEEAKSSLRISLGKFTTNEEIQSLVSILPNIVDRIRNSEI